MISKYKKIHLFFIVNSPRTLPIIEFGDAHTPA